MIIGSRQRLSAQCDDVEIRIDDQIIKRVDHTKSFLSASLCLQLKKLWGKADPVQTKHQLFETKLLLQRGHVME